MVLIEVVRQKLCFVPKTEINEFAYGKGIIGIRSMNKEGTICLIEKKIDNDMAQELIKLFSRYIGYSASEIENILCITKAERQKWTKAGLLMVSGEYQTKAYGKILSCPLYNIEETLKITTDLINEWRSSTKQLTQKQSEGLKKAQQTQLANRTCRICGYIAANKRKLTDGCCKECCNRQKAYARRKYWLDNKEKYCLLDTETTGMEYNDQIIEICILDLDGNELLNTLVMPTVDISEEAIGVHGITMAYLRASRAPIWSEVYEKVNRILSERIVIAYSAEFDIRMLEQTSRANDLPMSEVIYECLMKNVMLEHSSNYKISLQDIVDTVQDHRAKGDCILCLEVIKSNDIKKLDRI